MKDLVNQEEQAEDIICRLDEQHSVRSSTTNRPYSQTSKVKEKAAMARNLKIKRAELSTDPDMRERTPLRMDK